MITTRLSALPFRRGNDVIYPLRADGRLGSENILLDGAPEDAKFAGDVALQFVMGRGIDRPRSEGDSCSCELQSARSGESARRSVFRQKREQR